VVGLPTSSERNVDSKSHKRVICDRWIPENALIVLLPEEDSELCAKNQEMAIARQQPGQPLVYVRVEKLTPPRSRLVNPRVEVAA